MLTVHRVNGALYEDIRTVWFPTIVKLKMHTTRRRSYIHQTLYAISQHIIIIIYAVKYKSSDNTNARVIYALYDFHENKVCDFD